MSARFYSELLVTRRCLTDFALSKFVQSFIWGRQLMYLVITFGFLRSRSNTWATEKLLAC